MKKKFLIALAVLALVAAAGVCYTRPMSVQEIFPGAHPEESLSVWGVLDRYVEGESGGAPVHLTEKTPDFSPDTPEYGTFLEVIETFNFHRSLWNLIPARGSRSHSISPGDFKWRLSYHTPGGLIELEFWFDRLLLSWHGKEYQCDIADQDAFSTYVRDFLCRYTA